MKIFINTILLISILFTVEYSIRPICNLYQYSRIFGSFIFLCTINLLINLNVDFNPKRHEK